VCNGNIRETRTISEIMSIGMDTLETGCDRIAEDAYVVMHFPFDS